MNNLWLALITGLTTGGLSCFAVQGGLLTSVLSEQEKKKTKYTKEKTIIVFLIAKIVAYTILGALLGVLGSSLSISSKAQGILQILIGLYMIITAARLLDLHPIFKYFVIQPPKVAFRLLRKSTQEKSFLSPIILGALTILIPCGVTQAMMLLAVGSASAFWGAGIMFFFTLGSLPIFLLIGLTASKLLKHKIFAILASIFILLIGISSINSGQVLRGSTHTLQNYWSVLISSESNNKRANIQNGFQEVNILVTNNGYKSDINTLKVGIPVRLHLITKNVRSCSLAFTIPDLNLSKILPSTGTEVVEFTPNKLGRLVYSCSMGMYSGAFNVVE